jgi:nicotinamidase-related amidase
VKSSNTTNETIMTIDPRKAALLLLHWQKDIATPEFKHSRNMPERLAAAHTIEHTQAVLKASRENGVLIVFVNAAHRPGYPEIPANRAPIFKNVAAGGAHIRGSRNAEVIDQLEPKNDEIIVYNYSPSAFCYTDLDLILRNKGITDLALSGLSTNWAVETTARHGVCLGYFIYTLEDCCNSHSDEMHNWPMINIFPRLGAVIDSTAYITALQSNI